MYLKNSYPSQNKQKSSAGNVSAMLLSLPEESTLPGAVNVQFAIKFGVFVKSKIK